MGEGRRRKVEPTDEWGLLLPLFEWAGWLTALKLEGYASGRPPGPILLQEVLFPYLDAS